MASQQSELSFQASIEKVSDGHKNEAKLTGGDL
jgi:hypothetical protein